MFKCLFELQLAGGLFGDGELRKKKTPTPPPTQHATQQKLLKIGLVWCA